MTDTPGPADGLRILVTRGRSTDDDVAAVVRALQALIARQDHDRRRTGAVAAIPGLRQVPAPRFLPPQAWAPAPVRWSAAGTPRWLETGRGGAGEPA